jgi:two-component system, sensor histidine kinase PdtaS
MAEPTHITDCGLPGIRRIPYGLHACHFYPDRAQLVEALIPYFLAGLRAGERCIWVAAPPLPAAEAARELRARWNGNGPGGVDEALARGALRIVDYDHWYKDKTGLKGSDVVGIWLEEEERALAQGYRGLRITGNTSFVQPADWRTFMEYEHEASPGFQGRRIVALCSYAVNGRDPHRIAEVMRAHNCAFEQPDSGWQVTDAPEHHEG